MVLQCGASSALRKTRGAPHNEGRRQGPWEAVYGLDLEGPQLASGRGRRPAAESWAGRGARAVDLAEHLEWCRVGQRATQEDASLHPPPCRQVPQESHPNTPRGGRLQAP